MAKKLVSIDDAKTGEAALPEAVNAVLRNTYGSKTEVAAKVDKTVADATYAPASAVPDQRLARVRKALLAGSAKILNSGHSITEGTRSSAPGQRWTDVLLSKLRGSYQPDGIPGGFGYIPATSTYPELLPENWQYTGTHTVSSAGHGLSRFAVELSAGATATLRFYGTGITVRYTAYTSGPSVAVTIDGTAKTNIDANSKTPASNFAGRTTYSGLTAGWHTIVLTAPALFALHGASVHNGDESTGVRAWNAGRSGDQIGPLLSGNPAQRIPPIYTDIAPDLVTIEFAVNEYRNNTAVSTFGTNLTTLINQFRTAVGADVSILLVIDAEPAHGGTPAAPWSQYVAKVKEVAAATNVPFFDLSVIPTLGLSGSGMNADQVHPNADGHKAIGEAIAAFLSAEVGASAARVAERVSRSEADTAYAPVSRALPTGGAAGQVPVKTESGVAWQDAPSGGGTPASSSGDWRARRIVDVAARPRFEDVPTVSWVNVSTSQITSPVEYKPEKVGAGSRTTGWNGQSDPNFLFFPGSFETQNGTNSDLALVGEIKPGGSAQAARWPLVFSFTTSDVVSQVEMYFYGAPSIQSLMIEVNGRLLDDTTVRCPATFSGNSSCVMLTFPAARARTIRIWTTGNLGFAALRVTTGGTISKPAAPTRKFAIIGDSFVNGAGQATIYPNQGANNLETFAPRLGRLLGYDSMVLAGVGGTGWTTINPFSDRIAPVLAQNPSLLVFYGSINDGTAAGNIGEAVTSALNAVTSVPRVVVIGAITAGYEANANAVKAATLAAGREYVDLHGWLYGTGNVTSPAGNGNLDYFMMSDNSHPTLDAHRALAAAIFAKMTA